MNSSSVCIDASLALAWLLFDEHCEQADRLMRQWAEDGVELITPPLFHAEVPSCIRKSVYFKRILPTEGEQLFSVYSKIPVRTVSDEMVYRTAWRLATKYHLPACYDMQYLALAELMDCELWTLDKRLLNAVRGNSRVILADE